MSVWVLGELPISAPSTVKLGMSLCVSMRSVDLVMERTAESRFLPAGAPNKTLATNTKATLRISSEYNQNKEAWQNK